MIQLVAQMSNKAIGNGLQSSNREISDLVVPNLQEKIPDAFNDGCMGRKNFINKDKNG